MKALSQWHWSDQFIEALFILFFSWPVTGLGKSLLNYPDVSHMRWNVFFVSLVGLIIQVLAVTAYGLAYNYEWNIGWFAALLAAYYTLTLWRYGLYVSKPAADRQPAFG